MEIREQILATARLVLAAAGLVAIVLDGTEPTRYVPLAYTLLAAYVAWSAFVAAALPRGLLRGPRAAYALHGVDLAWASGVSLFTSGPSSPFFLFFVFALVASAYRWGMKGALVSAVAATVVLAIESALLSGDGPVSGDFELNRALIRSSYLLIMGYLLGFLGESDHRSRREGEALFRVLSRTRGAAGVQGMVEGLFEEILGAFEARAVAGVAVDADGRPWAWRLVAGAPLARVPVERGGERRFTPLPGQEVSFRLRADLHPDHVTPAAPPEWVGALPAGVPAPERSVLGVAFRPLQQADPALILVIDARDDGRAGLRLLERLAQEAAPALENAELVRRLRSRAGALERSRVARELHDGVLQTLSGLELEVGALRKRGVSNPEALAEALVHIQQQLHAEALTVRELMDAMRPVDVQPGELLEHLAQVVERFRRATAIEAALVSEPGQVRLSGSACREIVKVVQEALVNVRRHAAATNVVVRIERAEGALRVVVDDNGRGFPFEGRLDHAQMEASRRGPVVIRERVRAMGGRMVIESAPGKGSRVEVLVPMLEPWRETA